jgi:hypothetical protein
MADEIQKSELPNRLALTTATAENSTTLANIKARLLKVKVASGSLAALAPLALMLPAPWGIGGAVVLALGSLGVALFGGLDGKELEQAFEGFVAAVGRVKPEEKAK